MKGRAFFFYEQQPPQNVRGHHANARAFLVLAGAKVF